MKLQFEKFKYPEGLKEQRKLFIECFPENIGTPVETVKHYDWKFKSFPSEKPAYEYIAKIDNEMVGYYAAIPYPYCINNKEVKAAMVCDVMTGIKARGKGVFTKLGVYSTDEFKKEGLAFSTGYPIRTEVIPGHKKAGWEFPFQIPMYGKFLKMNSFLSSRNKKFLIPFANFFLFLYNTFLHLLNPSFKNEVSTSSYPSADIETITGLEDFLTEWKKENKIVLNKNTEFLKWRLNAPEKEYKIIVLKNGTKIIGYTILRNVIKENVPCVGILDFSVLDQYKKNSKILLHEIYKAAKKKNAELILIMMMNNQGKKYNLFRNGFLKTPYPFSFIIKQFDQSLEEKELYDEKNWNLMWIDSDDL
jgi:uncharacterized protein Veg